MQKPVGFDGLQRLDQRQAAMEAEPSSGMSMPLEIEAVAANPVQTSERRVEFFAQGLWLTGSIALDEPIAVSMPFAEDIDWGS